jgi:hypothetical protein
VIPHARSDLIRNSSGRRNDVAMPRLLARARTGRSMHGALSSTACSMTTRTIRASTGGRFVRKESRLRSWVTPDGTPGPTGFGGFIAAHQNECIHLSASSRHIGTVCSFWRWLPPRPGARAPALGDAEHTSFSSKRFGRLPLQKAAEHPCHLLVLRHAPGCDIRGRNIATGFGHRDRLKSGARRRHVIGR